MVACISETGNESRQLDPINVTWKEMALTCEHEVMFEMRAYAARDGRSSSPVRNPQDVPIPTSPLELNAAQAAAADSLQQPAVEPEQWDHINHFYGVLDKLKLEDCIRCNERWFDMELNDHMRKRCANRINNGKECQFTAESLADIGLVPEHLTELTQI
ncbi:hypothetical protein MMC17_010116 [Xylographa soralifera]|nr:hypothetical protein [Xylographa soralifera]